MSHDHAPTIGHIRALFIAHAETYYRRRDGSPTREAQNIRSALAHLADPSISLDNFPAGEVSRHQLRALQAQLAARKLTRGYIARVMNVTRRMLTWAVQDDLIDAQVLTEFQAVRPLAPFRSDAREPEPIEPVPLDHVTQTLPFLPRIPCAVVQLLQLTGSRIGEITCLTNADLDTTGSTWWACPPQHKTAHRGHQRRIPLDVRCQAILCDFRRPFVPSLPIFESSSRPNQSIRPQSVAQAITRACKRAGIPPWHPHQLRHAVATIVRDRCSIDAAQALLGHSSIDTTRIYARLDKAKAIAAQEVIP